MKRGTLDTLMSLQESFITWRWFAAAGVLGATALANAMGYGPLPVGPLAGLAAGIALYNAACDFRLRAINRLPAERREQAGQGLVITQMGLDIAALTLLLHFSGSTENPVFLFYSFHVIIAALLLPGPLPYLVAGAAASAFALVAVGETQGWWPHYTLVGYDWTRGGLSHPVVFLILSLTTVGLLAIAFLANEIGVRLQRRTEESGRLWDILFQEHRALQANLRKISHELRAPLGTVETSLQVIRQGIAGKVPDVVADLLTGCETRVQDLQAIVKDRLALAEAQHADAEGTGVSAPGPTIRKVCDAHRQGAQLKGLEWRVRVDDPLPLVPLGSTVLQSILDNVLSNAVKYTPAPGAISMKVRGDHHTVRIEVADTGIGVPQVDRLRVFDEFYRADNARAMESEGTGLGLAIVQAAVRSAGGTVELTAREGGGTIVTVTIPAVRE